ncbi:MAG: hypothetical protein KAI47_25185 [Deltaproteobacteria bacterium]|nr:hypothetical protein [Deltaproteobacteria bacterium]
MRAQQTLPCGNCNSGKKTCSATCTWGACLSATGCTPNAKQTCGNCGTGTQTCSATCTLGTCLGGGVCSAGSKQTCPNGCGDKTCQSNCVWNACSRDGQPIKKLGYTCWSNNHCGPGDGRCVDCWAVCDSNGNLHPDGWCQSCTKCSNAYVPC